MDSCHRLANTPPRTFVSYLVPYAQILGFFLSSPPRTPNSMPPPMIHVLCFPPGKIVRASLNLRFSVKKNCFIC